MPLAFIPSPHKGTFGIGPITIHMYGLMLLLGIVACIVLTGIRWRRQGGDWDLVFKVAVWGVAFGVVGARIYHDITSSNEIPDTWWGPFAVWQGGLGIWGGILLGTLAGAWVIRRNGASVRRYMDAIAPGLLLAQGIGRWGNWFNQELYGKPTKLAWGLEIDPAHRLPGHELDATYQPTFLYEFIYDVAGVGILLAVGRFFRIKPPALFALYVSYYCFGRFFEELLRIDPSHHLGPLRLNAWVSIVVFAASTAFFFWWQIYRDADEPPVDAPTPRKRDLPQGPAMAVPKGRVRGRG